MEEKADSGTISRMGVQMNRSQSHEPLGNLRDDGADGVVVAVVVLDADVQVVVHVRGHTDVALELVHCSRK